MFNRTQPDAEVLMMLFYTKYNCQCFFVELGILSLWLQSVCQKQIGLSSSLAILWDKSAPTP